MPSDPENAAMASALRNGLLPLAVDAAGNPYPADALSLAVAAITESPTARVHYGATIDWHHRPATSAGPAYLVGFVTPLPVFVLLAGRIA